MKGNRDTSFPLKLIIFVALKYLMFKFCCQFYNSYLSMFTGVFASPEMPPRWRVWNEYQHQDFIVKYHDYHNVKNFLFFFNIHRDLDLKKPIYQKTACYGHFGRNEFSWEVPKKLVFWHLLSLLKNTKEEKSTNVRMLPKLKSDSFVFKEWNFRF